MIYLIITPKKTMYKKKNGKMFNCDLDIPQNVYVT